ncbi:hypothetical protein [Streptomyces sp. XY533]|uniref:hypothetical protein n=1 Tax=Streptomyces sp. XY533 TaxID=1519481 RepID=UPI000A858423|nr:hypothetical protein [Streptomyces sp. XY533]
MESQEAADDQRSRIQEHVSAAAARWRQGDVIQHVSAVRLVDLSRPLSPAAEVLREAEGVPLAVDLNAEPELAILDTAEPMGYAIVSQTCDVVRDVLDQPNIQLCPIRIVPETHVRQVQKSESTQMVWLPQLGVNIAADLTRAFTVEKSTLIGQEPVHGVETASEIRNFSAVVARRFGRFAFPDDLHDSMIRFRPKIVGKHNKNSDEGAALRQVHQIRAEAAPGWDSASIEVTLHFILEPEVLPELDSWPEAGSRPRLASSTEAAQRVATSSGREAAEAWVDLANSWVALCEPQGAIKSFFTKVTSTELFSMEDMRHTEQLDMDYLSASDSS